MQLVDLLYAVTQTVLLAVYFLHRELQFLRVISLNHILLSLHLLQDLLQILDLLLLNLAIQLEGLFQVVLLLLRLRHAFLLQFRLFLCLLLVQISNLVL